MIATILATLGTLDRVKRVIKVLGMVNCTADFEKHPFVINGASELFAELWGPDHGIGVRAPSRPMPEGQNAMASGSRRRSYGTSACGKPSSSP